MAFQKIKKTFPSRAVHNSMAILSGIAAGGIHQNRIVGKPPIAVARAANTLQGRFAKLVRQRKFQSGIDQRGGFTRSGWANDDVPGRSEERRVGTERKRE